MPPTLNLVTAPVPVRCRCFLPLSPTLNWTLPHDDFSPGLDLFLSPPPLFPCPGTETETGTCTDSGRGLPSPAARGELAFADREPVTEPHHEPWFTRTVTEGGIVVHHTIAV